MHVNHELIRLMGIKSKTPPVTRRDRLATRKFKIAQRVCHPPDFEDQRLGHPQLQKQLKPGAPGQRSFGNPKLLDVVTGKLQL